MLCSRICSKTVGMAKLLTGLDVLEEHHLIAQELCFGIDRISVSKTSEKVNLFDSDIIHQLKQLRKDGEA